MSITTKGAISCTRPFGFSDARTDTKIDFGLSPDAFVRRHALLEENGTHVEEPPTPQGEKEVDRACIP
jgi:hypothetical protein